MVFKEETRNSTEKDESKDFGSKAGGRATSEASTTNDPLQRKKDLAEKLRRKSSTIIGDAGAAIWDLHPRLGQLGARDIASAMLAASA